MKKLSQYKEVIFTIIILSIFFVKGTFVNIVTNIHQLTSYNTNPYKSEINLLKENIDKLKNDLEELGDTFSDKDYHYSLSKLSYYKSYDEGTFYIYGGKNKNYQENYALANEYGLVGIISKVNEDYSECKVLSSVSNLTVTINEAYGSLVGYQDSLFIIENISNYDTIHLNDKAYTSASGIINEKIYIGYVYKIEKDDIEKKIYLKSEVDFNNINYLHVVGKS